MFLAELKPTLNIKKSLTESLNLLKCMRKFFSFVTLNLNVLHKKPSRHEKIPQSQDIKSLQCSNLSHLSQHSSAKKFSCNKFDFLFKSFQRFSSSIVLKTRLHKFQNPRRRITKSNKKKFSEFNFRNWCWHQKTYWQKLPCNIGSWCLNSASTLSLSTLNISGMLASLRASYA